MLDHKAVMRAITPNVYLSRAFQSETEIEQAVSLVNNSLGDSYTDAGVLQAQAEATFSTVFLVKSEIMDEVVGVAVVNHYQNVQEFLDTTPYNQSLRVESLILPGYRGGRIGVIKTVAVDSNMRGIGIGKKLIKVCLEELKTVDANDVYSFGWTDHEGCHIQGTLESTGFTMLGHLEDYFKQLSIELGFGCPSCGNPCRCSVKLFAQNLEPLRIADQF